MDFKASSSVNRPGILVALISAVFLSLPVFANTQEQWLEDIAVFRTEVLDPDPSYSDQARVTAIEMLDTLEANLSKRSDAEVELTLASISALANNGHSFLMPGVWTQKFNRIPVKFAVFADGVYITIAHDDHKELAGSKLISIDGHNTGELREYWSRHQGGTEEWKNQFLPFFLESPEILFAAGFADSVNKVQLKLQKKDGAVFELKLAARNDLPTLSGRDLFLPPSPLISASVDPGRDHESTPVYLQDAADNFRMLDLPELNATYIQFKANSDVSDSDDIEQFIIDAIAHLEKASTSHIILDERFNQGGDLNITRKLMQKLPEFTKNDGTVYVLVSGRTFSAGVSSVAYLKQAAGGHLVVIGEPIGDRLEFYAEGDLVFLPHSQAAFLMATERHNYITGCQEDDCHGSIKRNPIRITDLDPDYLTPLTYQDFIDNIDPAMIKVAELIRNPDHGKVTEH